MPSIGAGWTLGANNKPGTILNDCYTNIATTPSTVHEFKKFGALPLEIRRMIWHHASRRDRLVHVESVPHEEDEKERYESTEWLENDFRWNDLHTPDRRHRLQIRTRHRCNQILAVSQEARQVALEFYRVQIPCLSYKKRKMGHLYFSPEYDILHADSGATPEALVYILFDFKAYDSRGIGVLNLSFGASDVGQTRWPDPGSYPAEVRQAFQDTISGLAEVYFRLLPPIAALYQDSGLGSREFYINKSLPLNANIEEFEFVGPDPRNIDADLEEVTFGFDPRSMLYEWMKMERQFAIDRSEYAPQMQYMISIDNCGWEITPIFSRQDVNIAVETEESLWQLMWREDELFRGHSYTDSDRPARLTRRPLPAIGFWLLPLEALGPPQDIYGNIPEGDVRHVKWKRDHVADVSKHCPRLGLFQLPP